MNLNIFAALKRVTQLETDKETLLKQLEVKEHDLTEAQDVIGNFMVAQKEFDATIENLKTGHVSAIEALTKEHQTKVETLEVQLLEAKKSSGKEAANLLATLGVEPEAVKVSVAPSTGDILAKFEKLTGVEKTAFYTANREAILKATGLLK